MLRPHQTFLLLLDFRAAAHSIVAFVSNFGLGSKSAVRRGQKSIYECRQNGKHARRGPRGWAGAPVLLPRTRPWGLTVTVQRDDARPNQPSPHLRCHTDSHAQRTGRDCLLKGLPPPPPPSLPPPHTHVYMHFHLFPVIHPSSLCCCSLRRRQQHVDGGWHQGPWRCCSGPGRWRLPDYAPHCHSNVFWQLSRTFMWATGQRPLRSGVLA